MIDFLVKTARNAKESIANRQKNRLIRMIEKITASREQCISIDSDEVFDQLQHAYAPLPEYGYDALSSWHRACERALRLVNLGPTATPGKRALELGCGDGMVGRLLQVFGHEVVLVDVEDWRDQRAKNISFTLASVTTGLPFPCDSFDFIYSYNSFEHFSDPAIALSEMARVCRVTGHIYLDFGPLYASPWGLHAYRTLLMPYPQFLFSEEFLSQKLSLLGISDLGKTSTTLQHVNRWRVRDFESLWNRENLEVIRHDKRFNEKHLDVILEFPDAFRGRGLRYEDLVTYALSVLLRRSP